MSLNSRLVLGMAECMQKSRRRSSHGIYYPPPPCYYLPDVKYFLINVFPLLKELPYRFLPSEYLREGTFRGCENRTGTSEDSVEDQRFHLKSKSMSDLIFSNCKIKGISCLHFRDRCVICICAFGLILSTGKHCYTFYETNYE